MLERPHHLAALTRALRRAPVVALLGARQVGKSTLARALAERTPKAHVFDLEDPRVLARFDNPMATLEPLRGLVVLDEIHHRPDLFPVLRVLADRPRRPASFLVLGSAAVELLRQSAESLAGRIAYHELGGFDLHEVGAGKHARLWLRGGLPRSFLARSDSESFEWRRQFTRTYAERDLAALGIRLDAAPIKRFLSMLAHWHGQRWTSTEFARSLGVSDKTVRHWLDVLCATFMVMRLRAWSASLAKREVKAPKVYVADSGVLHALLDVADHEHLLGHPKLGASFEGYALGQVMRHLEVGSDHCFHWAVHAGPELDLLIARGRERRGFEFKHSEAPTLTASMRVAVDALALDRLDVVHIGPDAYALGERVFAVPILEIDAIPRLRGR